MDGGGPAPRRLTTLLRTSNQNGAPSVTANAVRSQPKMAANHPAPCGRPASPHPAGKSRRLIASRSASARCSGPGGVVVAGVVAVVTSLVVVAGATVLSVTAWLASALTAARNDESLHKRSPMPTVERLAPTASTDPMMSRMICDCRLYQPETLSMVSSNHTSTSLRSLAPSSPTLSARFSRRVRRGSNSTLERSRRNGSSGVPNSSCMASPNNVAARYDGCRPGLPFLFRLRCERTVAVCRNCCAWPWPSMLRRPRSRPADRSLRALAMSSLIAAARMLISQKKNARPTATSMIGQSIVSSFDHARAY